MFSSMGNSRRSLIQSLIEMVYFMRGAIQYKDAANMTFLEREMTSDFVTKRLESARTSSHPVF